MVHIVLNLLHKDSLVKSFNFFSLSLLQVVFSKYTDLLPKEVLNQDTPELQKPDEEAVKEVSHVGICMYGKHVIRLSYSYDCQFYYLKVIYARDLLVLNYSLIPPKTGGYCHIKSVNYSVEQVNILKHFFSVTKLDCLWSSLIGF